MHPLHWLALAIDEDMSKLNATYVLNDGGAHNPYDLLDAEFECAEDAMKHPGLDFDLPLDFNAPLLDEGAEEDEEGREDEGKDDVTTQGIETTTFL
jgi:hypothetical protein